MAGVTDIIKNAVKNATDSIKSGNDEATGLSGEMKSTGESYRQGTNALKGDPVAAPSAPRTGAGVGGTAKPYGSQGKEKRIDTSGMTSPNIKTYDKGGVVGGSNLHDGKHQLAILKEGERVLTPEQTKVYDKGGKVMATPYDMVSGGKTPKKEIKEMVHSKTHNGKHVITHKHHSPAHHPDETHMFNNLDEAKDHMDQHAGDEPAEGAAPLTAAPSPMAPPAAGAPGAGAPPPGM
jgi:hypothetical protein